MTAIFLMGTHSAIFGPSKYGLLPELLPEKKLSWGNGVLELGTFLAIILGHGRRRFLFGNQFSRRPGGRASSSSPWRFSDCLPAWASRMSPLRLRRKNFGNFLGDLFSQIHLMRQDRVLWLACLGNTYFSPSSAAHSLSGRVRSRRRMFTPKEHQPFSRSRSRSASAWAVSRRAIFPAAKSNTASCRSARSGLTVFAASSGATDQPSSRLAAAGAARVLRRLFHRADFRAAAAPPKQGTKGAVLAGGEPALVRRHVSGVGRFLLVLTSPLQFAAPHFLVTAVMTLAATDLRHVAVAGCVAAFPVVGAHADALSHSRRRPRQHSRQRRRAVRLQPRFVRGRAAAHRLHRPARALHHVQGHLRKTLGETVCENPPRHSHFVRTTSARNAQVAANRQRRHQQRRGRLHLCRRPDHAHRPTAAVPARLRAHHERRGRADHPRRARRRLGQHLQLRETALPLEAAAPHSVSRHGQFRQADAAHGNAVRGAPSRAGTQRRRVAASPQIHEDLHRAFVRTARLHPFRFAMADAQTPKLSFGSALVRTVFLARRLEKSGRDRKWSAFSCRRRCRARW